MDNNILNEELGRMKSLFRYERGVVISEQSLMLEAEYFTSAPGQEMWFAGRNSDNDRMVKAFQSLNSIEDYKLAEKEIVEKGKEYKSIADMLNNNIKAQDLDKAKLIQDKLKQLGVNLQYKTYNNGKNLEQFSFSVGTTSAPNAFKSDTVSNNTREQNIKNAFSKVKNGVIVSPGSKVDGMKWDDYVKTYKLTPQEIQALSGSKNKPAVQKVSAPKEMGKITDFQDWLDGNKSDAKLGVGKGWATGYTGGVIQQGKNGGGYGSYGPRTQKAWAAYGQEYMTKDVGALASKGKEAADQEIENQFTKENPQ